MNTEEIIRLLQAFDASSSCRLEYHNQDQQLILEKPTVAAYPQTVPAGDVALGEAVACNAAPVQASTPNQTIDAPLVGTFYRASAPDAPAFVQPGDRVKKGQTIGLIEAMKMISEIPCPCDCIIQQVVAEDGQLVGFGDALFEVQEL